MLMEQRINLKINNYLEEIKDSIKKNPVFLQKGFDTEIAELLNCIKPLELTKEDFTKRKRIKNFIPKFDRCIANRANGEQCTRRKKDGLCFCGTHQKGRPHGVINNNNSENTCIETKIEIFTEDINGIIYYLDNNENVYDPHDIINGINNPRIISKYKKTGELYEIIDILV